MSIKVRQFAELKLADASSLTSKLAEYYSNPSADYYIIADQASEKYTPEIQPFHCDLVSRIKPGMSLFEIGCGSAHLCGFVEARGGFYTGMDHNERLLEQNRTRFPSARFLKVGTKLEEMFDVVVSLYTIEHVVDPPAYLESMWDHCNAGGLIAIICPDFIDGDGLSPSVYYGKSPRRFREKILGFHFGDAFQHLFDLLWLAPRWKARARAAAPGAFWINLKPRILHGAQYTIDADAVHLPRLRDIVWWFEKRGAFIVETSLSMRGVAASVLRYNCYALAQKPGVT